MNLDGLIDVLHTRSAISVESVADEPVFHNVTLKVLTCSFRGGTYITKFNPNNMGYFTYHDPKATTRQIGEYELALRGALGLIRQV